MDGIYDKDEIAWVLAQTLSSPITASGISVALATVGKARISNSLYFRAD